LSNKSKIKAVFFDLGNTLVTDDDFMKNESLKLDQELLKSIGYNFSIEKIKKAHKKAVEYTQTKYRGNSKVHEKGFFMSVMYRFLGLKISRKIINELYEKFQEKHHSSFQLLPNAIEILSFLKNNDCKLVIISNGSTDGVNTIIDNLELRTYFDLIVISEDVGKEKSTTIPIKIALEKLKLKPDEAVMVGDRIDEDILGAKKLRMITVKYNYGVWKDLNYSNENVEPDFIINDLMELKEILHGLDNR